MSKKAEDVTGLHCTTAQVLLGNHMIGGAAELLIRHHKAFWRRCLEWVHCQLDLATLRKQCRVSSLFTIIL